MDFLDPKRKQANRRRLIIGYILMAIAVAMGTLVLLFTAYGFDIDRRTGNVIQNGTIFIDSQPGNSNVFLNGELQRNKTSMHVVVPGSRQYTILLQKDGYRDWARTLSLEGGRIERLTYPLLVPKNLVTTDLQLYSSAPELVSQSPDLRWLLVQQPKQISTFDLFDLDSPSDTPAILSIPVELLTDAAKSSTFSVVAWSDDNHHLLIKRVYDGKHEFLVLDTENMAKSVNLNTALGVSPSEVSFRDGKADQAYLYDSDGGVIRSADVKNRSVSSPLLTAVLAYKSLGSESILYVTANGASEGSVNVRIRENNEASYLLKNMPKDQTYLLAAEEFDGTPYFVVGSKTAEAVFVYRNPLPTLKGQVGNQVLVSAVLRQKNPQYVSFSPEQNFVVVQSATDTVVLDIENDHQYKTVLGHPIALTQKIDWLDSYHLKFVDNGNGYVIDFDGSNEQMLSSVAGTSGPFLASNFETVFNLASSVSVNGRFALTQSSLIVK